MKISELLGKPLISLADSSVEGILKDIIFDNKLKKARYFVLFDDQNETEEKLIPVNCLYSISSDVLVIKNNDCVSARDAVNIPNNNPASKTVFTTEGKVFGRVTDIIMDDKLNVLRLEINNTLSLENSEIAAFSDEMLIIYGDSKRVKITRSVPKPKDADRVRVVSVAPVNYKTEPVTENIESTKPDGKITIASSSEENEEVRIHTVKPEGYAHKSQNTPSIILESDEHTPQRIIGNYGFLLGRRVSSDIFNQRGDVIVKKDTVISPATVENARKYGRLVELTLHSFSG